MFYEDPNTSPNREGLNEETTPAPEQRSEGEYHYTRQTNPGTQSEPVAPNNSVPDGGSAADKFGAQSGSTAPNSGYTALNGTGNSAQNNDTTPNGGYSAQNSGYSAPNGTGNGTQNNNTAPNSDYTASNGGNNAQSGYTAPNGSYSAPNRGYGAQNSSAPNNTYNAPRSTPRRNVPPRPKAPYGTPPTPPKKRSGGAGKMVALALVCSLLGGMVGAGGMFALKGGLPSGNHATVSVSDRTEGGVNLNTSSVTTGESMTPAQIYKTYGDAVVCINISTSQGAGAGTGFIIDGKEGYVLTCYHVVDGAKSISVTLNDSTSYSATYVGGSKDQDCAIIKITPEEGKTLDLKSVVLGDSSKLEVGESVCTIGNALGTLANTLTSGTVSALNRSESMEDGTVMNVLQTDTSINSGNSGGPLFNSYGEVIGIVNAKRSSSAFSNTASIEGIAFAIPISDVTAIMSDLMEHGYVTGRPLLGVTLTTITQATAERYTGMVPGAYVRSVTDGTCAAKAGVKEGDIITSFDGQEVTSSAEVIALKRQHKAGDEVEMVVYRNGESVTLKLTLDEDPNHDNPMDDGGDETEQQGDYGYGFNFGGGDSDGNGGYGNGSGGYGYSFGFPFFGW